tara:strand:+ start:1247 stop:1705 length:459 start_codon:yes stop_codon:yes gene_type:complete
MQKLKDKRAKPLAEINVVPYIDVMLVLLVIFMITAPMLTQGITVDLPQAASEKVKSSNREPVIVSVNKEGHYFLNISDAPEAPISPEQLMVRVAAEIKISQENKETINILVKGDKGVNYGKVVTAMGYLKQAGAEQLGLMTDSINNPEQVVS